jgi:hypothetical protein
MNDEFWMVWREFGGTPTYKHPNEDSARREAERLARMTPGVRFYILREADSVVMPLPPVEWASGASAPDEPVF